jgi:hypothetical protein
MLLGSVVSACRDAVSALLTSTVVVMRQSCASLDCESSQATATGSEGRYAGLGEYKIYTNF